MNIVYNGEKVKISDVTTLAEALDILKPQFPYAVVVNDEFVPKTLLNSTDVREGDHIEILQPLFGG